MYALHPATVHIPIGLLLASSLFTLIALRTGQKQWEQSAYHCLIFGLIGAVVAIASGLFDAARQVFGRPTDDPVLLWTNGHAAASLIATLCYGRVWLIRRRQPDIVYHLTQRQSYLSWHIAGSLFLIVGGWLGGRLVFGFDLGR
ncbi:MAG: hypothetical protein C0184_14555 [Chloroflexus aggregans]|uniref:DUF2231 domain-containing protein n=1 Tax=Chloroflexus aggregans TaxID=152260 RepID=A0A2J6WVB2_9CHLR|nr:MAG: hypothetical protein C0184_14555 [Chloroflexus aggregans]